MKLLKIFLLVLITLFACTDNKKPTDSTNDFSKGYDTGYKEGFYYGLTKTATQIFTEDIFVYADNQNPTAGIFVCKKVPDSLIVNAGMLIILPDTTTYLLINGRYSNTHETKIQH